MLLAEVAADHATFRRISQWTRSHLRLSNGVFAWPANAAGRVAGQLPASDADLLIAWALLRYRRTAAATWHSDRRQVAAAILAHEVTTGPGRVPVLAGAPGPPAGQHPSTPVTGR